MQSGQRNKQQGATFLGILIIVGIIGLGLYGAIRLVPIYLESMAITRAINQVATAGGVSSPASIRILLERRWEVEDIKTLNVKDIEINKVSSGTEIRAAYRAEAPFVGNVSLVVDFDNAVVISGASSP